MDKKPESTFSQLRDRTNTSGNTERFAELAYALSEDAFKHGGVKLEPYYWAYNDAKNNQSQIILCQEVLTDPKTQDQQAISMQAISDQASKAGSAIEMDLLVIRNILKYYDSTSQTPLAINISAQSAFSNKFWDRAKERLRPYDSENFIFEILEHDVDPKADIKPLLDLKEQGYRFALDDYLSQKQGQSPEEARDQHQRRLKLLAPILDVIKFDGTNCIKKALSDPEDMAALEVECERLLELNPDFILLAEHVPDFIAAQNLPTQISLFQGRDLTFEKYMHYVDREQKKSALSPKDDTIESLTH